MARTKTGDAEGAALDALVRAGDRRALARAITLVESTRADHRRRALSLVDALMPCTGDSLRIGISGSPGVGKSTFIEVFGLALVEAGHKVAVLAVDPSSQRAGGAILGDKTRMQKLARVEAAFIRPSPTGGAAGGVARRTRDAILVCEAAGFDRVLVETVGVGQTEVAVADMVDMFLLLLQPGSGDELQGIKKGIVESADAIIVTKSDGELAAAAERAQAAYQNALRLLRPASAHWRVPVMRCSALAGEGLDAVLETVERYRRVMTDEGAIAAARADQARAWLHAEISAEVLAAIRVHPAAAALMKSLERDVTRGAANPAAAARRVLAAFLGG